jgi:hypothetical protein
MSQKDVERILRDVLTARGMEATVLHAVPRDGRWQLTIKDVADRVFVLEVPDGPAATIRGRLEHWTDGL